MKFFFDESGDFDLRKKGQFHFVGTLICPDTIYQRLCEAFLEFKSKTFGSNMEAKGSAISIEQKFRFIQFLKPFRDQIRISITGIHPDHMNHEDVVEFRKRQASNYEKNRAQYIEKNGEIASDLQIFKRLIHTASNSEAFSDPEFVQANVSYSAVHKALQTFLFNYYDDQYCAEYKQFDFIFDRKHPKKLSAYEKHIKAYMLGQWEIAFMDGQLEPLIVMPDFKAHSNFNKMYKLPNDKVNLSAIFKKGFQFQDSKSEPGLQIIDIIVNTIYSAVHNRKDKELAKLGVMLLSLSCRLVRQKLHFITMRSADAVRA